MDTDNYVRLYLRVTVRLYSLNVYPLQQLARAHVAPRSTLCVFQHSGLGSTSFQTQSGKMYQTTPRTLSR